MRGASKKIAVHAATFEKARAYVRRVHPKEDHGEGRGEPRESPSIQGVKERISVSYRSCVCAVADSFLGLRGHHLITSSSEIARTDRVFANKIMRVSMDLLVFVVAYRWLQVLYCTLYCKDRRIQFSTLQHIYYRFDIIIIPVALLLGDAL